MSNVNGIRQSELCRRIQEDISNALDDRSLFALPDIQDLEKSTIALAQVQNVTEHFFDKLLDLAWPDNRRSGGAKRADV